MSSYISRQFQQKNNPSQEKLPERKVTTTREKKLFIRSMPLEWITRAAKLPGKSTQVALAIWFRSGLEKFAPVQLSNTTLARFGVDRHAKRRALLALEKAELISVDRRPGKNPVITITDVSRGQDGSA